MAETDIQLTVNLTPGDVRKSAEQLQNEIQKTMNKISTDKVDSKLTKVFGNLDKINTKIKTTSDSLTKMMETKVGTENLAAYEKELQQVVSRRDELLKQDPRKPLLAIEEDELVNLDAKLSDLENRIKSLKQGGSLLLTSEGEADTSGLSKLSVDIESTKNRLAEYNNDARVALMNTEDLGNAAAEAGENFQDRIANGILRVSQGIGSTLKTVSSAVLNIGAAITKSGIGKLREVLNGARKSADNLGKSSKRMLSMILRASLGVRGLFMLFRKIVSAIKEGISNFTKYQASSNETAKAVDELKGSLSTLKNSFGAAFAPIINAIAPALNYLISLLIKAANAFSAFMAALFGGGTFIKATKQVGNLNKGLGGTAKAADKAKRALAGFDDLDVLNPETDDDSGGGGGAGGLDYDSMFETATIPDQISEFAEKVKEAWEKADFTEVGNIVGLKLKESLELASEYITTTARDFARKLASSIATFVNGFVKTEGLGEQIGTTLADAINTAITFALTLLQTMDFKAIGRFIGDAINGFFEDINWEELAQVIYLKFVGIFQMIGSAVSQINWYDIGTKIAEGFATIDWGVAVSTFFEGIGKALGGIGAFIWGIFKVAWDAMWEENFAPYLDENGQMTIGGWLLGMATALANLGKWIDDHIFRPFINGFKQLFRIESPSKVMEELGRFVMLGFLNAVSSFVAPIIQVFTDIKNKIVNTFQQMWNSVKSVINGMISGIEKMANSVVSGLNTVIDALNGMSFGPVPDWVPFIGGKEFRLNIPKLRSISIPRLAQGAVIPPNSEFLAMLGDQRHGTNIEAPLDMIKEAFEDVVGNLQVQNTGYSEMVLDGQTFARLIVPYVISELNRQGYDVTVLEG